MIPPPNAATLGRRTEVVGNKVQRDAWRVVGGVQKVLIPAKERCIGEGKAHKLDLVLRVCVLADGLHNGIVLHSVLMGSKEGGGVHNQHGVGMPGQRGGVAGEVSGGSFRTS